MANSRKDNKGRKLRDGETLRSDGRYCYRYLDNRTGKRKYIYASNLEELREKEKLIAKDIEDNILVDSSVKKMTLNTLFERYMQSREFAGSTRANYVAVWNNRVKEEIGNIKVVCLLPSHIKMFYAKLSKAGYSNSTIKCIHDMVYPALEMAVDDNIIRKNPAKISIGDYGRPVEEREALTIVQQEKLMNFVKTNSIYNVYVPMLTVMLETGLRCGELIGLIWEDVDLKAGTINIDHQLIYKNLGEGCRFYISMPKTKAGVRVIPMTKNVYKAFEEQKKLNFLFGKESNTEIDGYGGFVFTAKTGRPLMPSAVNNVLYNIVEAYNEEEVKKAKKEHRKAELLPKISAHILRHTACTRMAEQRIDIKVLQYIMGHANIDVTMQVYNHLGDMSRVANEIARLDEMAINF